MARQKKYASEVERKAAIKASAVKAQAKFKAKQAEKPCRRCITATEWEFKLVSEYLNKLRGNNGKNKD
jgi:hypothetical protein